MPEFIAVPAGPFTMGISSQQIAHLASASHEAREWRSHNRFEREQPAHTLALPDFSLAKNPVTVGDYRAFIKESGYETKRFWTTAGWEWRVATSRTLPNYWDESPWTDDDRLPVVGVSWFEAIAFCVWLGTRVDLEIRLPSEAEWEKGARGSSDRIYPWGDFFDRRFCNTRSHGVGRTIPITDVPRSGDSTYGISGLIGNVSEWTSSRFEEYPYDPNSGREDTEEVCLRVTRGGSWSSPDIRARATSRGMNDPWFADRDLGFRVACIGFNVRTP